MQILFRLHFFCNVGFYCSPLSLMDLFLLPFTSTDFCSLSLSHPPLLCPVPVFDLVSTFIQINFDSSFSSILVDEYFLLFLNVFFLFFSRTITSWAFPFFIADSFHVQQKESPFFDSNQNSNITVLENESVELKCVVRNKGNKTVSREVFLMLKP